MDGNRNWAFTEARRRARALDGPYSIYRKGSDYIIRAAEAAPPKVFQRIATIEPDGSYSFGGEEER